MNYTLPQLQEFLLYRQNQVIPAHYTSTRQKALFAQKWAGYSAANGKHYLNNKEIIFDEDKTAFLDRLVNDPRFEMFSKGWSAVYTFLKDRYVNIHQSDVIAVHYNAVNTIRSMRRVKNRSKCGLYRSKNHTK